jgi:hypothetical protein
MLSGFRTLPLQMLRQPAAKDNSVDGSGSGRGAAKWILDTGPISVYYLVIYAPLSRLAPGPPRPQSRPGKEPVQLGARQPCGTPLSQGAREER